MEKLHWTHRITFFWNLGNWHNWLAVISKKNLH